MDGYWTSLTELPCRSKEMVLIRLGEYRCDIIALVCAYIDPSLQVVMAGDFFQASTETFCFEARAWLADIYSLEQGSRQIEPGSINCCHLRRVLTVYLEFITILQRMRFGKIDPQSRSKLNSLSRPVVYPDGISGIEM